MSRNALLQIKDLTVQSGAGRLRDFSLTADRGLIFLMHADERWKITTLFKVLAGLESPLEGDISYRGEGIGLVLAEDELSPWSRIRSELELYAGLKDLSMQSLERLMESWNLEGIYALPAEVLSIYERKAFFMVLETASKPDLLLCQEPLEGLNPRQQRKLLANLRSYADQGHLVVMGTVDPGQYPGSMLRVSLDRTPREHRERVLALKDEKEPGQGSAVPASEETPLPAKKPSFRESAPAEPVPEALPLQQVPDSGRISQVYRGQHAESRDSVRGMPRMTKAEEPDTSKLLSTDGSFGGRRILTIFVSLPVSPRTEYELRRIPEIKYFQSVDGGYELDILEEDRSLLPELLKKSGLDAAPDGGSKGREEL